MNGLPTLPIAIRSMGAFLVRNNRVLNGPLGCSLRSFARTAHSAKSLRSALFRYAHFTCSIHGLAHSLCSLPRGTSEIFVYVLTLIARLTGTNAFFIFTRNTPIKWGLWASMTSILAFPFFGGLRPLIGCLVDGKDLILSVDWLNFSGNLFLLPRSHFFLNSF